MSQLEQVQGGVISTLQMIGGYQIDPRIATATANQRDRHAGPDQFLQLVIGGLRSSRGDNDSVGPVIGQRIESANVLGGSVFTDANKKAVASLLQDLADGPAQLGGERVRNI